MKIVNLTLDLVDDCVELFLQGLRRQADASPALEIGHLDADAVRSMLADQIERTGGVAATDNTCLVGYMTGWVVDGLLGPRKAAYSPEWAHAALPEGAFDTYCALYRAIGQQWVDLGCATHVVNLLHAETAARESLSWNGFGFLCLDAVRKIEPIGVLVPPGLHVTRMGDSDIEAGLLMANGLNRHLAASPSFKPDPGSETAERMAAWLTDPDHHAWLAWKGSRPIGYMKCEPIEEGAAWIVRGEGSFAVNGAFVYPEDRVGGVAKTLLSTIMTWAWSEGYKRCSVDFEAANHESCRFWLRHFQPVCVSMLRRLDERILQGGTEDGRNG